MKTLKLIRMFRVAYYYSKLNPAAHCGDGPNNPQLYAYHRTIVSAGKCGLVIGFLLGLFTTYELYAYPHGSTFDNHNMVMIYLSTPLMIAIGMLGGACWAGLFAPALFISGPIGALWLVVVGSKTPRASRIKSMCNAVSVTAFFILFPVLVWLDKI